jgi:beta-lactamase regulating signal transducer with metallopeptidase domain
MILQSETHLDALTRTLTALAPALKNHLWQSTIFALVAALLTLALRHNQARTRYRLWLAASLKFLVPLSLFVTLGSHLAMTRPQAAAPQAIYFAMQEATQPFTPTFETIAPPAAPANHLTLAHLIPTILAALWLCGFAIIVLGWIVQLRRIAATIHDASPALAGRELEALRRIESLSGLTKPTRLLLSPASLEPGIFGIFRPTLLWPARITEHLEDAHLDAILAHELCHVRRRDNLTAALHMLVSAVFWFHPLVWFLGARLLAERERACDEAVLHLSSQPRLYAESILKVCEFCLESPLPCVSGVTGANLKSRIATILTNPIALKLGVGARLLLLSAGIVAVGVPIMLGQMKGPRVIAAMKATARVEAGALSFAERVWSPIEPEPSAPSNALIPASAAPEYQIESVKLAEVEASLAQTSAQPTNDPHVSRANVQPSLGFEEQTSTKLTGWFANPADTVFADDRVVHTGRWSARLQRNAQSKRTYSVISRSMPLDFQGHVVELRGYLRLQDVSDVAGLWLGEDNDGQMIELENMGSQQVKGTRDWAQYRITLPINPRTKQLDFGVLVSGTGTLWADDLELLVDGEPIAQAPSKQPLTNADIIDMSRAGVSESTIVLAIQNNTVKFDVSAQGIVALHAAGITEPVLNQMLRGTTPQKSGPAFGVATGSFPVKDAAGKTVRFSAWIKTENVQNGYAGLWWRVDGPGGEYNHATLAFDNSQARFIDGKPDASNNTLRGATGTTPWTRYEFELPVDKTAANIYFGVLFTGTGTAWVDAIKVELDGVPYSNPEFDFDFESPKAKGFYTGCGGSGGRCEYRVGLDDTVSYYGHQSLKMQYVGDGAVQK